MDNTDKKGINLTDLHQNTLMMGEEGVILAEFNKGHNLKLNEKGIHLKAGDCTLSVANGLFEVAIGKHKISLGNDGFKATFDAQSVTMDNKGITLNIILAVNFF